MAFTMDNVIRQEDYSRYNRETAEWVKNAFKKSLDTGEFATMNALVSQDLRANEILSTGLPNVTRKALEQEAARERAAKEVTKGIFEQMHQPKMNNLIKAGVTTGLGYNFYDLRAPVMFLYPVNTPLRNEAQRIGRVNDGFGTQARWMATRTPGLVYGGVSEGNRNAVSAPDQNSYSTPYKGMGVERSVTFESQWAGEGFTDELADEHIRGLHTLFLQEESMILNGNAGTGALGFTLGTAPTPTTAVTTTHTVGTVGNLGTFGGADLPYTTALTTSSYVTVYCVLLSGLGNPNNSQYGYFGPVTITSGLTPSSSRSNADGSHDTINGGISAVSAGSTTLQATSGNLTIKATVSGYPKGTFGFAWFVDVEASNTGSTANAYFAGVTQLPFAYISGTATGTQTAAATGLNADHTSNTLDFDGLLTQTATQGGYWKDMAGGSFTSEHNGRVTEVENALATLFQTNQTGVDEIWGSANTIRALDSAIRYNASNSNSGMMLMYSRDQQNNITGGFVVSGYQSRYAVGSPLGADVIPLRIHPMMPEGTLYFNIRKIPNGYEASRMKYVYGLLTRRDYYSIEWPVVTRSWTFGTYVDEVLAHVMPWTSGVITGVGPFVGA